MSHLSNQPLTPSAPKSPPSVTKAESTARIAAIRRLRVHHLMMGMSGMRAINCVYEHEEGCMSALVGPTRVGKTTLLQLLTDKIVEEIPPVSTSEVPVVYIELKASEEGPFNWKDFYRRILKEVNPLLADMLPNHRDHPAIPGNRATYDDLRRAVEESLKLRKTRVILLDEAHHISLGKIGSALDVQLERLKSFANTSKVHLVLAGPYQLLPSINVTSQLASRITPIHFPRYQHTEQDLNDFNAAIFTLVSNMEPWTLGMELTESTVDYFYHRSLGCFGLLKPWLLRAAVRSADEGTWVITKNHLDETCLRAKALRIILDDIEDGEKSLKDTKVDWKVIEDRVSKQRLEANSTDAGPQKESSANNKGNGKNQQQWPGNRKPERDPTGLPEELDGYEPPTE